MDSSQLAEDDANTADDPSSVAPHFYRGRAAGEAGDGGAEAKDCSCDEEEGFAGGTQQQKSAWGDGWSVRKGSALTLDHLASVFREDILPFVLPPVDEGLRLLQTSEGQQPPPDAWLRTEAAVLTLGAVAQGCQTALAPHLGNVMACLLELSQHPKVSWPSVTACCGVSLFCASSQGAWLSSRFLCREQGLCLFVWGCGAALVEKHLLLVFESVLQVALRCCKSAARRCRLRSGVAGKGRHAAAGTLAGLQQTRARSCLLGLRDAGGRGRESALAAPL